MAQYITGGQGKQNSLDRVATRMAWKEEVKQQLEEMGFEQEPGQEGLYGLCWSSEMANLCHTMLVKQLGFTVHFKREGFCSYRKHADGVSYYVDIRKDAGQTPAQYYIKLGRCY